MNANLLKAFNRHLDELGLSPEIKSEPYPCLIFFLAEGIQSELVVEPVNRGQINLALITMMDVRAHSQLSTFAMTLAPRLIPVQINTAEQQIVLQLNLAGSRKSILPVLDEGIVLMRHIVGAIFTEALKLTSEQSTLFTSLEASIKLLHSRELS